MADELIEPGQAQCEITGRWVPEDELVVIHGRRVCAEGKAQLLELIRTGQLLPGEMLRASGLARFGGWLLDALIIFVVGISAGFAIAFSTPEMIEAMTFLLQIAVLGYLTLMHVGRGQTLGKMAAGIRVVNIDGTPVTMRTSLIRTAAYGGPHLLQLIMTMIEPLVGGIVGLAAFAYFVVNVVLTFTDAATQRSLHDRIAGTRVIQAR